jgi:MerR family transcriptional regulator, thiopeptide resistance regulator
VIRVREFARLGGVTVKALLHYDRLGLLTPARTSAGHRAYTARDFERLRRILALKRVGIALTRMGNLLDAEPSALTVFLETSRRALAHEQRRLLHTGRAIALVEESLRHAPDDDCGLSRLADVLDMPLAVACMKRYFADDVWEQARRFYEDWPADEWIELFRSLAAAIPDGPASARAEELLTRWNALGQSLWRGLATDPDRSRKLHEGFARAWRDRENWPDTLRRRFADYQMNEVAAFLARVSVAVLGRRGPRWFAEQREALHASYGSNQGAGV